MNDDHEIIPFWNITKEQLIEFVNAIKYQENGVNKMFNLNAKEAFKLMLDGKDVIDEQGYIYSLFFSNIIFLRYENNIIMHRGETDANTFLKYNKTNKDFKFKEYIEPKPRKFEFEAFIGEKPDDKRLIFQEFCTDKAFGHGTTGLYSDRKYVEEYRNYFNKISKFKITMEEILE